MPPPSHVVVQNISVYEAYSQSREGGEAAVTGQVTVLGNDSWSMNERPVRLSLSLSLSLHLSLCLPVAFVPLAAPQLWPVYPWPWPRPWPWPLPRQPEHPVRFLVGPKASGVGNFDYDASYIATRFHSLLDFALQSANVGNPTVALTLHEAPQQAAANDGKDRSWSYTADALQKSASSRKELDRRRASDEDHAELLRVGMSFTIFTEAAHARQVRQTVNTQLAASGGLSLQMGIDQLELSVEGPAEAQCSAAESRPCERSDPAFGACSLQKGPAADQELTCMRRANFTVVQEAGEAPPHPHPTLTAPRPAPSRPSPCHT